MNISKRMRILIVEDEEAHAELMRRAFKMHSLQAEVEIVTCLDEARMCINGYQPDLVLTDVWLPDGSGIDLVTQYSSSECPVIVMTSHGDERMAVEAMKSGAMDYVVKTAEVLADIPHIVERALRDRDNIRQRRQAEEALRESEDRYRQLVENLNEVIFQLDAQGRFTYISPVFKAVFGVVPDAYIGMPFTNIVLETDSKVVHEGLLLLFSGQPAFFKFSGLACDGAVRFLQCSMRPRINNKDVVGEVVGVISDQTEQQKMQRALVESQQLADIGVLTAGVAHEIKSPLQIITGASEGLLEMLGTGQVDEARFRRQIEMINRNGWRIAELARSLLNYARSSSGQLELFDVNDIIKDTLLLVEHQLSVWANVNVLTDLTENLPPLPCDRNKVIQVLINLLMNAKDAMPSGGEVVLRSVLQPDQENIVIQVEDNGCGISDETMGRIFEPFFTTKGVGEGTGLGLYIVKDIMRMHGGDVKVDSKIDEGTTFTLLFPYTDRSVDRR